MELNEPSGRAPAIELLVQFCPVCSQRLGPQHGKMVCPPCGYFMSCTEYE